LNAKAGFSCQARKKVFPKFFNSFMMQTPLNKKD
jgi:hypothetical protein